MVYKFVGNIKTISYESFRNFGPHSSGTHTHTHTHSVLRIEIIGFYH
jgi:hypothetical protein